MTGLEEVLMVKISTVKKFMKKLKSYEWRGGRREESKQCDQCSLFGGLNLALPYTPSHKPGLSVSFIKICDRPDIAAPVKRAFLAAQEAWNHLVRVGIMQMNKLCVVGIFILGKHLSLERVKAKATAADSFSLSVSLLTASSHIHPISSAPFAFARFFFFFPIWYSLVMCLHVSVNTYWVYNILHLCHRSGTRVNLGDLFYYYDNILPAVVCKVITWERG